MSSYIPFPDASVSRQIEELAQRHGLSIVQRTYTPWEELEDSLEKGKDSKWDWILCFSNQSVQLKIVFFHPSYVSLVTLKSESDHFSFEEYLKQHLKSPKGLEIINSISKERRWPQDWTKQLEVLDYHLSRDLDPILRGKEWPEVYFNWEDYVEPEALERMHSDAIKIIERHEKAKSNFNPWVYLVNFIKGKDK